jgi:hypothetical protein
MGLMGPQALQCPNCAAPVQLRGYAQTVNAVCGNCLSILDTKTASLRVIQESQTRQRIEPHIPLGQRGRLNNTTYEAIGFQVRTISVEGVEYSWREYLLFNPYKGYRYLSEYDGHWNVIDTLRALPENATVRARPGFRLGSTDFAHFQSAQARTTFVLGEFPWQVRLGDTVDVADYVAPPHMLSAEITQDETTWSRGVYTPPDQIWKAFGLPGSPPQPKGVFSNQPSPYVGKIRSVWRRFFLLLLLLIAAGVLLSLFDIGGKVFEQRYSMTANTPSASAFVTSPFELPSGSNLKIDIDGERGGGASNFGVALINEQTGQAFEYGANVGFDDEYSDRIRTGWLPAGRYYLRVDPAMETDPSNPFRAPSLSYRIKVARGGVSWLPLFLAAALLLIPAIVVSIRAGSFENTRWQESDYGAMFTAETGDDD